MLTADQQAEILSLHFSQGKKVRTIARLLGINRKSVKLVINRRSVQLGRTPFERKSILDPYKDYISELLRTNPTISSSVILQRIRSRGFTGGITILQEWVSLQRQMPVRPREAFLTLTFEPGQCAQVDWGEFGDAFGDGIKIHCFAMVLCYSRLLYVEFTRSESFEEFIRCHENAFKYFGGVVPAECWYDNLRSAVVDRLGSLIKFNSRFMAYMGHHHIRPHACNPARGNEKGRVESAVKLVRYNFWPGRKFKNFDDLNGQARVWLHDTANMREHRALRKVPRLVFDTEERAMMQCMNPHDYDTDEVFSRVVPPTFHIQYDTNRYSVPWTLVGIAVTVRVNDLGLKIYYNERSVTSHERSYGKNQIITKPEHGQGLLERKPGGRDHWQTASIKNIGPRMSEYVDLLKNGNRSLRSEISRILALATVYGHDAVHAATEELLSSCIVGVENMELLLKARHPNHDGNLKPAPMQFENQKLNRVVNTVDLRRFDALLIDSAKNNDASKKEEKNERPDPTNGTPQGTKT